MMEQTNYDLILEIMELMQPEDVLLRVSPFLFCPLLITHGLFFV